MICTGIFVSLLIAIVGAQSRVKISNNGYTDIVVGIHSDIQPDQGEPLIDKIKDLFTSASAALYTATRKRSYFKEVRILVPKSWPKKPNYKISEYEVITQADVKIEKPNPLHGDGPHTVQPSHCENPGRYIHLTPNYLRHLADESTRTFGDPGRTLVHEWAHFRYGIFDEYAERGRAVFPAFYLDPASEDTMPNACTNVKLVGKRWNPVKQEECVENRWEMPDEDCIFLVDIDRNDGVTSSIASHHFLPNAHMFCDDTDEHRHNAYAPNRHNKMCNRRSTWNVITSHEDFKSSNQPRDIDNTVPNFIIVQEEEATIALVLDISTSMLSPLPHTKMNMLYEAATRFLKEEVKLGTAISVVLFSNSAELKLPMIRITNEQERQNAINHIPNTAGGYTCIGCGLRIAAQDLRRFRGGNGGIIVLLSDGEENRDPKIADVTQEILNANIRVITIAFTAAASPNMEALALASGGKSFYVPLEASVIKLGAAFLEVSAIQTTQEDVIAKLLEKRYQSSSVAFTDSFYIDASIGRDSVINFLYNDKNDINDITINGQGISVSLATPSTPDVNIEQNDQQKQIKFTFTNMPVGMFTYTVNRKGSTSQDMTVTVLSKARNAGDDPIVVDCTVYPEKTTPPEPPKLLIVAEVKKGTTPVVKAQVITRIDRPNAPSVVLQLFDSGKKGDVVEGDGIYSGYFIELAGPGRYGVQATVVANAMTAIIETGFTSSNALEILTAQSMPPNVTEKATGDFQRVAEAGSIQITENFNSITTDLYPPSQIDDLQVVSVTGEIVTLEWSAPGDDLYKGQATEYDLRYTMDFDLLSTQFFGRRFNDTHAPKPAGETEIYEVELIGLGSGIVYYVALRSKDDSGKWSDISNLVEVKEN